MRLCSVKLNILSEKHKTMRLCSVKLNIYVKNIKL